jgi:dienelactone hydrolase
VTTADDAELFLYPGDPHLFVDSSLAASDPAAAAQLSRRVLELLARA